MTLDDFLADFPDDDVSTLAATLSDAGADVLVSREGLFVVATMMLDGHTYTGRAATLKGAVTALMMSYGRSWDGESA